MAIEFTCNQCSCVLRVPDEHAGKQAKCPKCSAINSIPHVSQQQAAAGPGGMPQAAAKPDFVTQNQPQTGQAPYNNPYMPTATAGRYVPHHSPHRGGLILTLGILAIVCNPCGIPGILAWIMGAGDLKKIRSGQMDPQGESLTTVGMILGIIGTVLVGLVILIYALVAGAVVVGGNANF